MFLKEMPEKVNSSDANLFIYLFFQKPCFKYTIYLPNVFHVCCSFSEFQMCSMCTHLLVV